MRDISFHENPSLSVMENKLSMELLNEDMWREFHAATNEMIITKNGRRMFPFVEVEVRGLEPKSVYALEMEFVPACEARLKFQEGKWMPSAPSEVSSRNSVYRHPESPNYGWHWMNYNVSFAKVKITNRTDSKDLVVLNSHHKYCIEVRILKLEGGAEDEEKCSEKLIRSFRFPLTEFIAVTAYQNEEVTALKIKYNPFAKAFQTNNRCKSITDSSSRMGRQLEAIGPVNRVVTPSGLASYKRAAATTAAAHAPMTSSEGPLPTTTGAWTSMHRSRLSSRRSPMQSAASNSSLPCPNFGSFGEHTSNYSLSARNVNWPSRHSTSPLFCTSSVSQPLMSSTPFTPSHDFLRPASRPMPSPALPNCIKQELPQDLTYHDQRAADMAAAEGSYFAYPIQHHHHQQQQQLAGCLYSYAGSLPLSTVADSTLPLETTNSLFPQTATERTGHDERLSSSSSSENLLDPAGDSWIPVHGLSHYSSAL